MIFDMLDDVLLGNHYTGIPAALSGIVGAIVAGLLGHDLWKKRYKWDKNIDKDKNKK